LLYSCTTSVVSVVPFYYCFTYLKLRTGNVVVWRNLSVTRTCFWIESFFKQLIDCTMASGPPLKKLRQATLPFVSVAVGTEPTDKGTATGNVKTWFTSNWVVPCNVNASYVVNLLPQNFQQTPARLFIQLRQNRAFIGTRRLLETRHVLVYVAQTPGVYWIPGV